MKVSYDKEADAAYIQFSELQPESTEVVGDGINVDTTEDGKLVGIEILDVSEKFPIESLYKYEIHRWSADKEIS